MGWYKRSKFAFDAFRNLTSKKLIPKNPIQQSIQTTTHHHHYTNLNKPFSIFSKNRIFSDFSVAFRYGFKQTNQLSPFLNGEKRCYNVDRQLVFHFRPRGYKKWFGNLKNIFVVVIVVGSGLVIKFFLEHIETVPYTKRIHFVRLSGSKEKDLGEFKFDKVKASFEGKILPETHPDSLRVILITENIIEALQRGLKKEQVWSDLGYGLEDQTSGQETDPPSAETKWHNEDEILDDKWAQQSRKKDQENGVKSATGHLEGLNWEVIVVNAPVVNAGCLPGGKIVVWTGLLEHLKSDSEVATIIGHEVAHIVARHSTERTINNWWFHWFAIVQSIQQFVMPDIDIVNKMSALFLESHLSQSAVAEIVALRAGLRLVIDKGVDMVEVGTDSRTSLPSSSEQYSREMLSSPLVPILRRAVEVRSMLEVYSHDLEPRMEMEADYIGLLLMASAGYDPRIAPKVYEELENVSGESELGDYFLTHPSGKKRAQMLAQAEVMAEALIIYWLVQAGRLVNGFL